MARQRRLNFIQWDIDACDNRKIRILRYRLDDDADLIFLEFIRAIFAKADYYIKADDNLCIDISIRRRNWPEQKIRDLLNMCLELDLFDKNLYDQYGILTSAGIQDRFFQTIESAHWRHVKIIKEYFLLDNLEEYENKKGNTYEILSLKQNAVESFDADSEAQKLSVGKTKASLNIENVAEGDVKSDLEIENTAKECFKSELSAVSKEKISEEKIREVNLPPPIPPDGEPEEEDFERWFAHYPCDMEQVDNPRALKRHCKVEWKAMTVAERKACMLFLDCQIATHVRDAFSENGTLQLSPSEIQARLLETGLSPYPLIHLRDKGFYATQKPAQPQSANKKPKPLQAMRNAYTKSDWERPFVIKNHAIEC